MAVSDYEFKKFWALNPSAAVAGRNPFNSISAIRVSVMGIKGGRGGSARMKMTYNLYIDVEHIRSEIMPSVWVEWPTNANITHVNIFPPSHCAKLGRDLPSICWGANKHLWQMKPNTERTLIALCDILHAVLMDQNFESAARSV